MMRNKPTNPTLNVVCSVFCGEAERKNAPYLLPLGIVYCATAIRQLPFCKVSSLLFDMEAYYDAGEAYQCNVTEILKQRQTDVLCISGMSNEYVRIKRMIDHIKKSMPEICIVIGGGMVSAAPFYVMTHTLADYGIVGEGEKSLPQLLTALYSGESKDAISGLVLRRSDGTVKLCESQDIADLDALAFPDYSLFPDYEEMISSTGVYPMLLSRSCPYHCTFCFHTSGRRYRARGVHACIDEIEHAAKKYNIKHIFFFDELFGADMDRVKPILEKLHAMGIAFNVQTRADLVTDEMARFLAENGCKRMSVGIESASNQILKSMNKKTTIEVIQRALETALENGMKTSGNIIIGDVEETRQTAAISLDWFDQYRERYNLSIGMIQCYPGTSLYAQAKERGLLQEEAYLEHAEFSRDFVLNLTTMPQEDFRAVEKEVLRRSFLYRESPQID